VFFGYLSLYSYQNWVVFVVWNAKSIKYEQKFVATAAIRSEYLLSLLKCILFLRWNCKISIVTLKIPPTKVLFAFFLQQFFSCYLFLLFVNYNFLLKLTLRLYKFLLYICQSFLHPFIMNHLINIRFFLFLILFIIVFRIFWILRVLATTFRRLICIIIIFSYISTNVALFPYFNLISVSKHLLLKFINYLFDWFLSINSSWDFWTAFYFNFLFCIYFF